MENPQELRPAAAAVVTAIRRYLKSDDDLRGAGRAIDHLAAVLGEDDGRADLYVVEEGEVVLNGKRYRLEPQEFHFRPSEGRTCVLTGREIPLSDVMALRSGGA